jgi:hypothetical protein
MVTLAVRGERGSQLRGACLQRPGDEPCRLPFAASEDRNTEWQQSRLREWPHTLLGRAVPAALLPSVQSRLLARHLRGELPSYMPWLVK